METTKTLPTLLNQKQVAEYLGISKKTLEKARFDGEGIPFHRIGRQVRYQAADVLAFVENNKFTSTSSRVGG